MEYSKVLNRSVNIVWQNKFLIVLGFLAALGSGSYGSSGAGNGNGEMGQFPEFGDEIAGLAVGLIAALVCVLLFVAIVFWVISTIARGGLIAGVDSIESGEKSSFGQSWSAGWQKVWTLIGIGLLPAIPGLILFVLGLLAFGIYGGFFALFGEGFAPVWTTSMASMIALIACIVVPIMLVLSILRNFAERACMLEESGVIDAYRRGWEVLTTNIGEAIILFVLQIAIFIGLAILLIVPSIIVALCCLLWPLFLVVQGAVSAFISALWTLAWRTWTGEPPIVEKEPTTV